tara:strand:+ start:86 stop:589 length:504 start_codon:yes stop_codon:yes gene_type:complete
MVGVEERLIEMFQYLPSMKYDASNPTLFPVVFGFGDDIELNVFLNSKENDSSPYPLVWLLYPYKEKHFEHKVKVENMVLILAVHTDKGMQNPERLKTTYKNILIPLYDNIATLLKKACITNLEWSYDVEKHPNYGSGQESNGVFIWDALRCEFSITITDDCLKPITI